MTIDEAKIRLKRARSYLFAITRELNKIDELWRKICSPTGPRLSLEMRSTAHDNFKSVMFDQMFTREKDAKELYDYVLAVERELRQLARSFPDEAQVLDLHYVDRYSFKEIAEKLRFSEPHIRRICYSGLEKYKNMIQNDRF